jgi:hypothetical protein
MIIRITSVNIFNITRKIMRKIYTKTFVYFAEIQYIYNEINNRNIIMDILNFTYYFLIYNLIFN